MCTYSACSHHIPLCISDVISIYINGPYVSVQSGCLEIEEEHNIYYFSHDETLKKAGGPGCLSPRKGLSSKMRLPSITNTIPIRVLHHTLTSQLECLNSYFVSYLRNIYCHASSSTGYTVVHSRAVLGVVTGIYFFIHLYARQYHNEHSVSHPHNSFQVKGNP